MKKIYSFTLIELLVVVGIIVILAGLLLPAVMGGAEQGRITQAKSDMKAILMALNQMETTYQKMWNYGSAPTGWTAHSGTSSAPTAIRFGEQTPNANSASPYENFILVLTAPRNASDVNVNTRRLTFLEPRTSYDPSQSLLANRKSMWKDPWGNEYAVIIDTSFTGEIANPKDKTNKKLSAKAIAYSFGPNGTDNDGKNVATGGGKLDDDITSWE